MKHLLTLFFIFLAGMAYSQDEPSLNGNPLQELRETYSTLDASRITTGVLMDQVIPLSRPQYFAGKGDTAATYKNWQQQYHEFYNASLTQTNLPLLQKIRDDALARLNKGAVPLLMLRYDYNQLKDGMAQDGYITLDSVNSRVYDGPDMGATHPTRPNHCFRWRWLSRPAATIFRFTSARNSGLAIRPCPTP